MCVCMCVCMYVRMYVRTYVCMYVCMTNARANREASLLATMRVHRVQPCAPYSAAPQSRVRLGWVRGQVLQASEVARQSLLAYSGFSGDADEVRPAVRRGIPCRARYHDAWDTGPRSRLALSVGVVCGQGSYSVSQADEDVSALPSGFTSARTDDGTPLPLPLPPPVRPLPP